MHRSLSPSFFEADFLVAADTNYQLGAKSPYNTLLSKVTVGSVIWHRIIGCHGRQERWDCLQVGRLMWDLPTSKMAKAWTRLKFAATSNILDDDQMISGTDVLMLIAYAGSIARENAGGVMQPIPLFQQSLDSTWWQKTLPNVSQLLDTRQCTGMAQPVEENVMPLKCCIRKRLNPTVPFSFSEQT